MSMAVWVTLQGSLWLPGVMVVWGAGWVLLLEGNQECECPGWGELAQGGPRGTDLAPVIFVI